MDTVATRAPEGEGERTIEERITALEAACDRVEAKFAELLDILVDAGYAALAAGQ